MQRESDLSQSRYLQTLGESLQRVSGCPQIDIGVPIKPDAQREHEARELQAQREFTHRGAAWCHQRFHAETFPLWGSPAKRKLLSCVMLIVHVPDAGDILPSLPRVLRVELFYLLFHRHVLCVPEVLVHATVLRACLRVPHWTEPAAPISPLPCMLFEQVNGIDHSWSKWVFEQALKAWCEAVDAFLHPTDPRVGHNHHTVTQRARH
mmetsp:Transcript_21006/g.56014  ORF Transcript_21006/g.56014 Transcript_21006/m.56014 type:complete len:207 (+) Transcript_21006:299-919(+)